MCNYLLIKNSHLDSGLDRPLWVIFILTDTWYRIYKTGEKCLSSKLQSGLLSRVQILFFRFLSVYHVYDYHRPSGKTNLFFILAMQKTGYLDPMLVWCWASVDLVPPFAIEEQTISFNSFRISTQLTLIFLICKKKRATEMLITESYKNILPPQSGKVL